MTELLQSMLQETNFRDGVGGMNWTTQSDLRRCQKTIKKYVTRCDHSRNTDWPRGFWGWEKKKLGYWGQYTVIGEVFSLDLPLEDAVRTFPRIGCMFVTASISCIDSTPSYARVNMETFVRQIFNHYQKKRDSVQHGFMLNWFKY